MKKTATLLCLIFAFSTSLFAQTQITGSIQGKVTDTSSLQILKDATISILEAGDSTLEVYGVTKADGSFLVENIPLGKHILVASFQGYSEHYKTFELTADKKSVDVGNIRMQTQPAELEGVTVRTPPMVIKGDTSEFNAAQFKTKPNATAEDLLKKMPGVEVDKDGTVKAQGQTVKRVMVDGKRFFGDDPTLATRNLPTDVIDKIQVYDAQSDQSAFSGFDDGNRETTINIITKKDRRKGVFGKASGGVGTDDRYAANVNMSYFNGSRQISFIGQANNNNSQNFSTQDILGSSGGGGGQRGGGGRGGGGGGNTQVFTAGPTGITKLWAGGLNYNDVWSPKTSVNGSYFYNNRNVINNTERLRETFGSRGDSSLFTASRNSSNNKNANHRFNFEIEHKFDSMNSLLIRPYFTQQESDSYSESNSLTTKGTSITQNDVRTINNSQNSGYNFNNTILYRHRFAKRGRSVSLNFTQGLTNNETDRRTLSYNNYLKGSAFIRDTIDQLTNVERDGKSLGANLSYTEPIGTKGQMELNYNYNYNSNNSDQKTMRLNKLTKLYDQVDTVLSNNFENTNNSHRVSVNYRRQITQLLSYTLGMGVQHSELTSNNLTKNKYLSQSFNNFFPTFSLQYRKNRSLNLRFNYRGSTRQPGVTQLQDVVDNSNPLNITSGNPALKQEFSNNINLFLSKFDVVTFKNFVVGINGSMTSNQIGNAYTINFDSVTKIIDNIALIPGAQYSKPVNLNGGYNLSGFMNYGFPLKNPKSNINLSTNIAYNRSVNLINDVKGSTSTYSAGETVRFTMNLKERLDLNFSSKSTYYWSKYSQQVSKTGTQPNANYFTEVLSVEPTYSTKGGFIVGSDFDYMISRGQSAGYNQAIPLWNASIAQLLFKKKQGELRLSVFDLLNQNKSITRTVDQNYIEDVKTQVLRRYFLLTFTYNLRKFGGKQISPNGPGMFRERGEGGFRNGGGQFGGQRNF